MVVALAYLASALPDDGDLGAAESRTCEAIALAERIGSYSASHLSALTVLGLIQAACGDLSSASAIRTPTSTNFAGLGAVRARPQDPATAAELLACS